MLRRKLSEVLRICYGASNNGIPSRVAIYACEGSSFPPELSTVCWTE